MKGDERKVCPTCRRPQRVRKDGTLFKHKWWGWECSGSGASPYIGNYRSRP